MDYDYGSANQKQHLNLSPAAYEILQNDMSAFMDRPTLSGFINLVLSNYKDQAGASISSTIRIYEERLRDKLDSIPDSPEKEAIIAQLVQVRRQSLLKTAHSYPSGISQKIRLNKDNFNFFSQSPFPESAYYKRCGQYIKAIIEEYASKNFFDREAIIFQQHLSCIENAVATETLLVVTASDGNKYEVRPYRILSDRNSMYHYLVGMARLQGAEQDDHAFPGAPDHPASFRINRIQKLQTRSRHYRSGHITADQKAALNQKLKQEGTQFLLEQTQETVIRLTPTGEKMYQTQLHLRPAASKIEGCLYTFHCTPRQIIYYFFKFGKEAEVLKPTGLHEHFKDMYLQSYTLYSKSQ